VQTNYRLGNSYTKAESAPSADSAAAKKAAAANRRNLRHRKIHSLRRQIQIKEKMLEVRKDRFIRLGM